MAFGDVDFMWILCGFYGVILWIFTQFDYENLGIVVDRWLMMSVIQREGTVKGARGIHIPYSPTENMFWWVPRKNMLFQLFNRPKLWDIVGLTQWQNAYREHDDWKHGNLGYTFQTPELD